MNTGTVSASSAGFSTGELDNQILITWISRALYGINLYHDARITLAHEDCHIELADERDALLAALKYLGNDPGDVLSTVNVSCKSEDFA
jgi:hypothetical protein